jgi:tetratricopeptide (TPR) repeat protein
MTSPRRQTARQFGLISLTVAALFLLFFGTDLINWISERHTARPGIAMLQAAARSLDQKGLAERATVLAAADAKLAAGQPDAALQLLQDHLSKAPDSPDVYLKLAEVLLRQGEIAPAYRYLREAYTHAPDHPEVLYQLGMIDLLDRNLPAAREVIAKLKARGGADRKVALLEAQLASAEGRLADAATRITAAAAAGPEPLELRWYALLAHLELKQGHKAAADQIVAAHLAQATNAEDLLALGKFALSTGDLAGARRHFARCATEYPRHAEGLYTYAEFLATSGDGKGALAAYRQALTVLPGLPLLEYNIGRILLAEKDLSGAMARVETLARTKPGHALGLRLRAQIEMTEGRRADARRTLLTLSGSNPNAPGPRVLLAALALQEGELSTAEQHAQAALTLGDRTVSSHVILADVFVKKGQLPAAKAELDEILKIDPAYLPAMLQLADVLLGLKQYAEAEALYAKVAAQAPSLQGLQGKLAWAKIVEGRPSEGLALAESVWKKAPADPAALLTYANALAMNRQLPQAISLVSVAAKQQPKDFRLAYLLGDLYWLDQAAAPAIAAYRQALAANPDDPNLVLNCSAKLAVHQQTAEAERILVAYVTRHPGNVLVTNQLAWLYVDILNTPEKATPLINTLRSLPNEATILDTIGWYYFKLGKPTQAENFLRDAIHLDPNNAAIRKHLDTATKPRG